MNSGIYAACAGLVARTQALDAIANNLANESTPGFRARHNVFRSMLAERGAPNLSTLNQDTNDYGVLADTSLDETQGSMTKTGNDLDVALEGPGYFAVQTARGAMYTRAGNFRVSSQGQLVNANGDAVLGDKGPITIAGQPVSISPDGAVSVNGVSAGKISVVAFPAGTNLQSEGNTYLSAPAGSKPTAGTAAVRQGMIENSNVNAVTSVVELINAQREVESMRRVLTMFSSELDKTAAQDLPRTN